MEFSNKNSSNAEHKVIVMN